MEDFISQLLPHLRGIWRYRWLAATVSSLAALVGWCGVHAMPQAWESSARVQVDSQAMLAPLLASTGAVSTIEQQAAIVSRSLLSRPNIERVLRVTGLDTRATGAHEHEQQIRRMAGAVRITNTRARDIYTISYTGPEPHLARAVVQALLNMFVESSFQAKQDEARQALHFIDQQLKACEERLLVAENALQAFRQRHGLLLPLQGVEDGARQAAANLIVARQARRAILDDIAGSPSALPSRIGAARRNLDALRLRYTELHPDVVHARRVLARLEANRPGPGDGSVPRQLALALKQANARIAAARIREADYGARHARLPPQENAVSGIASQLARLTRDHAVHKDNFEKLAARREAARLAGALAASRDLMGFRIIDPPTLPAAPAGAARGLLYSLVLLAALAAGPGAALLASQVRPGDAAPAALREQAAHARSWC